MVKKMITLLLTAALLLTAFAGCTASEQSTAETEQTTDTEVQTEQSEPEETPQEEQADSESIFGSLALKDLEGNEVDATLFEGHKLTMVNIWATFCGPCLDEMPELGELAQEYAQDGSGVQIVGLVTDVVDQDIQPVDSQIEAAKQIVEETGASYTHLVPDEEMYAFLVENVIGVPTTYFIDEQGNFVGDPIIGANDKAGWQSEIASRLEMLEN